MKLSICPRCRVVHEAVGTKVLDGVDDERLYDLTHCKLCEPPSATFRQLPDQPDLADNEIGYPMAVVPWMGAEGPPRPDKLAISVTSNTSTSRRHPSSKS